MSTIDKRIYLDALRQRLGDVVTANDMERVQKILGHVKITTTQLYIYVDDTDVQHDYMKYR